MSEKSSEIHLERRILSADRSLEAARFVGMAAGTPIGIIQDIRSGLGKVFNPIKMRYKSPQKIAQLEKRIAELEQRIHEFRSLNLSFSEESTKTIKQARAVNGLAVCNAERRMLNTIFRHNLKLQKLKSVVK